MIWPPSAHACMFSSFLFVCLTSVCLPLSCLCHVCVCRFLCSWPLVSKCGSCVLWSLVSHTRPSSGSDTSQVPVCPFLFLLKDRNLNTPPLREVLSLVVYSFWRASFMWFRCVTSDVFNMALPLFVVVLCFSHSLYREHLQDVALSNSMLWRLRKLCWPLSSLSAFFCCALPSFLQVLTRWECKCSQSDATATCSQRQRRWQALLVALCSSSLLTFRCYLTLPPYQLYCVPIVVLV